ncbi:MAG: hypothetical protein ACRC2K_10745, partial [Clostridium sp.]
MFGKIGKLTYNELLKQFKKKSVLVIFSLILISAIILPVVGKSLGSKPRETWMDANIEALLQDAKRDFEEQVK